MATEKKSSGTVTIASKLPHPLIMRVFEFVEVPEPVMGGGTRMQKQSRELPTRYLINGCAHPQNAGPKCEIVGGYALTPNIPKDFWDKWMEHYKDSMMVKNKIIFAQPTSDSLRSEATEHTAQKSGLERLVPSHLKKLGLEPDKDAMDSGVLKRAESASV